MQTSTTVPKYVRENKETQVHLKIPLLCVFRITQLPDYLYLLISFSLLSFFTSFSKPSQSSYPAWLN